MSESPPQDLGSVPIVEDEYEDDVLLRAAAEAHLPPRELPDRRSPIRAAGSHSEERDDDEEDPYDAEARRLKAASWRGTVTITKKYISAVAKETKLEKLGFDTELKLGQVRAISESHV